MSDVTFVTFLGDEKCDVTFVTFLEKNVTLSHTKICFVTCDVFCHILPQKRHILAPLVQKKLNGKKYDDSAGTETYFSLPVSDFVLISEAYSVKAIWAKTDPYYPKNAVRRNRVHKSLCQCGCCHNKRQQLGVVQVYRHCIGRLSQCVCLHRATPFFLSRIL